MSAFVVSTRSKGAARPRFQTEATVATADGSGVAAGEAWNDLRSGFTLRSVMRVTMSMNLAGDSVTVRGVQEEAVDFGASRGCRTSPSARAPLAPDRGTEGIRP